MKQIETEEMKALELNILVKFAEYCDAHNLRYYLYAGTLLGALRHQGFIPWDDDIDVVMPRPDYERFLELSAKEPVTDYLQVLSSRTCDSRFPFIKLVDSRTDGQEAYISKEFHCGIWIDIFPLDGVPEDAAQRNAFIAAQQAAIKQLSNADRAVVFTPNPLKLAKRIWISLRYRHMDYRKLTASLDENARKYSYEDSKLIGVTVFCGGHNNVIEKAGFEDAALLPFEGRSFKVPGTYREYLAHLFGPDYMTPPPERKRFQQHYYSCWWKDSAQ